MSGQMRGAARQGWIVCTLIAGVLLVAVPGIAQQTVFTSQARPQGDIKPGAPIDDLPNGLDRADAICQSEAANASLPGASQFKAWLSTSSEIAAARIPQGSGPYVLPPTGTEVVGPTVAMTTADLLNTASVNLLTTIDRDAGGSPIVSTEQVWTGTRTDGTWTGFGTDCAGWSTSGATGFRGLWTNPTGNWTQGAEDGCNFIAHLYCFGPPPSPVPAASHFTLTLLALTLVGASAFVVRRRGVVA